MLRVLTANEMRMSERKLFETGVSSLSVMEEAAKCLASCVFETLSGDGKTCVFACGSGGNGADGYAAARIFSEMGGRAIVLKVFEPKAEDALINYEKAKASAFAVIGMNELSALPRPDAWADCIFGIGLSKNTEGAALACIERINRDRLLGSLVFACDIPSGLHADTGKIMNTCVIADKTVTFQCLKRGHLLGNGPDVSGEIVCHPIGIPETMLPTDCVRLIDKAALKEVLPIRKKTAHKNDFGHLLIIAGSVGMAGACAICANAAMRTGAGLVSVFCPESIVPIVQTLAPCAMCIPAKECNGAISDEAVSDLIIALQAKTAVAVGPGLSTKAGKEIIKTAMTCEKPCVIDADGLNLISENPDLKLLFNLHHAITPHPGEALRLLGNAPSDPCEFVKALSALGTAALLKGAVSIISHENTLLFSSSGHCGMAKGGSGDALTGMTGAFLAMGVPPFQSLWMASELHGLAGEKAGEKYGRIAMLPTDLVLSIGDAYEEVYCEGL